MLPLEFNKNIPDLEDNLSHIFLKSDKYSKLKIVSLHFKNGYDHSELITLVFNDKKRLPLLSLIDELKHSPSMKLIPVNKSLPFNNLDILLKIEFTLNEPFSFILNYQYYNEDALSSTVKNQS